MNPFKMLTDAAYNTFYGDQKRKEEESRRRLAQQQQAKRQFQAGQINRQQYVNRATQNTFNVSSPIKVQRPSNPVLDGIKAAGDFTGNVNKTVFDTGANIGKGLVGTVQRAGTTVGQAGVGLYGAGDTLSSIIRGDRAGAERKNRQYVKTIDQMGQGKAIDGGSNTFLTKRVMTGKASPVEFGKQFVNAGVETSSVLPSGRVLSGVQKAAGFSKPLVKDIIATNAKQAAVYGTATTANDALQGHKINAGTLAANYGAPLALGTASEFGGVALAKGAKTTAKAAQTANEVIERKANPRVAEIDTARANMQRAFDVETDPTRRAQINKGLAQLNQERQAITQGGYIGNRQELATDIVPASRPKEPIVDKVAPTVKAKIDVLKQQEDLKPTIRENGRYVQSNDFLPEDASGKLKRQTQIINKKADEAVKSEVRIQAQKYVAAGMMPKYARELAEKDVLARPDLAQMQQNRTDAITKAIEQDSVTPIKVKTPRSENVTEFVVAPTLDDAGKASYELFPLDKSKHQLKNGMVVDKNGRSVGSYVGIDKEGNQIAYVEGKPVNINKVTGDIDKWGNLNSAFEDMDRLIEKNAPDKATARKVQEFTTVFKDQQEAQMKTEIATRRKDLQEVENAITADIPNGISKDELSKDMFRMMERKVDINEMYQKYGQDFIDNKVAPTLEWARQTFDEILNNTNRVLVRNGFDEIPRRDNYITHIQEDPNFWQKVGIGIDELNPFGRSVSSDMNPGKVRGGVPDEIVGNTDVTGARRRWNPFAQARKGDQTKQDFFASMDAYIEPMMFNQYMTPAASRARIIERAFRTYEKAKQLKFEQLADVVGLDEARKLTPKTIPHKNFEAGRRSPLVLAWQEYGNMLAGKTNKLDRRIMELGEGASKAMDASIKAQGIVGANSIPGSTTAALAQVLSIPQTIARDSGLSTLKAAKDMLALADNANDPLRKSSFMRARYTDAQSLRKTPMQKYLGAAAKPMEMIEREISELSWRSAYHEALKKGKTGMDAIRTADIEAKKTLAGRGVGDRPVAMNSKALGIVTQFGLEVNNMRVQFWKDFTPKQKVKFAVAAATLNTLYGGLTGQTPLPDFIKAGLDTYNDFMSSSDDSKDTWQDNALQGGQRALGETSKFVPGASTVAGMLMSDRDREKAFGKNGDLSRFGTPAATRVVQAGIDAAGGLASGDFGKVGDAALSVIPTGAQIKRTLGGAGALNQGYIENSKGEVQNYIDKNSALNWAQGLLFGKYSLPGQQDAMNRNQSLSEKQSKAFKELYKKNPEDAKKYIDKVNSNKADNPRQGTLTDTGSNKASAASEATSATQLKVNNEERSKKYRDAFSEDDWALLGLSKADKKKLVKQGAYTQEKIDGLEKYAELTKKRLGYEDADKKERKTNKTKYDEALSDYKDNVDSWSDVQRYKKEREINTLKVKKDFEDDTVDLYGLNKADVWNIVSNHPNGNKMVEDMLKYGDALVNAGLSPKNKFRDKYGNVILDDPNSSSSGSGSGRKGRKGRKLSPSSFKLPTIESTRARTKGAQLAMNAKLSRA